MVKMELVIARVVSCQSDICDAGAAARSKRHHSHHRRRSIPRHAAALVMTLGYTL